ncbi:hypothetical protein [Mesobacillus subterraneus]|uniref:Uncharacterized protein n=1 Tax=Mesobacillus subterraneus TaxID=285983 RepID=A0A0D6ZDD4_9BACI|nr:hypothetical protein [Mesobacillus subterraneus]KIY23081.1 hypothetical protein UB32_04805 [Mesobacillus subterraneus]
MSHEQTCTTLRRKEYDIGRMIYGGAQVESYSTQSIIVLGAAILVIGAFLVFIGEYRKLGEIGASA